MKYFLSIMSILLFVLGLQSQDKAKESENHFVDMAGLPYRDYNDRINILFIEATFMDSTGRFTRLGELQQVARESGDRNLELEARLWATQLYFDEAYAFPTPYLVEDAIRDRLEIAEIALKENRPHTRMKALQLLSEAYRIHLKDYDLAFEYLQEMGSYLEGVSVNEIPEKVRYLLDIGNLYYWFHDYERAELYYSEIIKTPEIANRQSCLRPAYDGLGLIYRNNDNLTASDLMFRAILDAPFHPGKKPQQLGAWEGVATGNLGYNAWLRSDYSTALPMLTFARNKMLEHNDHDYASGMAITLADIYLEKGDTRAAKRQLDVAQENLPKAFNSNKHRFLYPVLAKYYAATGSGALASHYIDSAMVARDNYNREFDAIKLMRMEQQLHRQELDTEQVRSQGYKRVAVTVSVTLVAVFLLLLVIVYFYRKKRNAYRELVRKSQQWAAVPNMERAEEDISEDNPADNVMVRNVEPSSADMAIMEKIEQLMKDKKLYTNPDLSLDNLAAELGIDRRPVSGAINICAGKNFFAYLNEYRVKEAIQIMSEKSNQNPTIDDIAFRAGFNERRTFHRIFKQFTGLTPAAFRNNL